MSRRLARSLLVLALTVAAGRTSGASAATEAERAQALFQSAQRRIASGSHEQRQSAHLELEDATRLAPERSDIRLALGLLDLEGDRLHEARTAAEALTAAPDASAGAWALLGRVWRRYWLLAAHEIQRDQAIVCLARATRLDPRDGTIWRDLVSLLTDAGETEAARDAAIHAARLAPADAHAQALLAACAQATGDLATAERLFATAIPRLPPLVQERYRDVSPLLPPRIAESIEDLTPEESRRFTARFWAQADPDPITTENEAQLEYWSRVTQACELYGVARPAEWDVRAQYYVRFGRPAKQELNPIYKPERLRRGDWVAWTYPELGLRVWTGTGSGYFGYSERISGWSTWAMAAPDSLERRHELDGVHHGWAVFHHLPPGVEALDTRLALAQFRAGAQANLFAQAESPGVPADRLEVRWALQDDSLATIAEDGRTMSPSACRADEARSASFTAAVAPGRYRLAVQVTDAYGRRAARTRDVVVAPPTAQLALSDLVVTCASPAQSVAPGVGVRLEPETGLFPTEGDDLHAYFEIYELAAGATGRAEFVYDCEVRPERGDRRGWISRMIAGHDESPLIEISRTETAIGSLRRQFLDVPVGELPAGRYVLDVAVRDVGTGQLARSSASFERRAAARPGR